MIKNVMRIKRDYCEITSDDTNLSFIILRSIKRPNNRTLEVLSYKNIIYSYKRKH